MISISFTLQILIAIVLMSFMYASMNLTDGAFLKNVIIYAVLSTIVVIFAGLRGIGNLLIMWILYFIEGLPMVWIMSKLYEWADGKMFITISVICWFFVKFIINFLNG